MHSWMKQQATIQKTYINKYILFNALDPESRLMQNLLESGVITDTEHIQEDLEESLFSKVRLTLNR